MHMGVHMCVGVHVILILHTSSLDLGGDDGG